MNKERILLLAGALERETLAKAGKLGFNMQRVYTNKSEDLTGNGCGTCACLVGWTVALFDPKILTAHNPITAEPAEPAEPDNGWVDASFYSRASELLGFDDEGEDEEITNELFMPNNFFYAPEKFPPARAVAMLRNLAATGEVVW